MVSLYIYSILITLTALLLIWVLYKTNEELETEKQQREDYTNYIIKVCRGCKDCYENKLTHYENQIFDDTDLIDNLLKENWELKNDRW
jgi:hypothetical protein